MAFNGSAPVNKRPRVDIRNDVDSPHKIKSEVNHGEDPRRKRPENPENCVLLYTIYNAVYPITTEVIHTISSPSGNVLRIVIFKKTGVQAMVEFDSIESAKRAKESLNGADIYSGCCTLKIEYAKPSKLNVRKNDTESWDYTINSGREEEKQEWVNKRKQTSIHVDTNTTRHKWSSLTNTYSPLGTNREDFWLGWRRAKPEGGGEGGGGGGGIRWRLRRPAVFFRLTCTISTDGIPSFDVDETACRYLRPVTDGALSTRKLVTGKADGVATRPPPLLQDPRFGAGPQPYRAESGRSHGVNPFSSGDRYDDFHGGGGEYGDRFHAPHSDRFKREFGREPAAPASMGNRATPGFRGTSAAAAPGALPVPSGPGPVMMVYGLDTKKLNCDRLFNLFCLYGNVARIKFLKTKEGAAMIQMGDGQAVERCVQHLNNAPMFNSKNRLQLGYSKQLFLSDVTNPFTLPDGTPSFKDFIGNKHNRFVNPAMSLKNRIQSPSRILHFFNTPPTLTEETLLRLFEDKKITPPTTIKIFPMRSERSSSGLLEFEDIEAAIEALVVLNHAPIENPNGKFPYTMKLCFSSSRQVNANGSGRTHGDGNEGNELGEASDGKEN